MNIKDKLKISKSSEENNIWESIADLMSGLMIIFLFIAIAFMTMLDIESKGAVQTNANIKRIVEAYNKNKSDIYDDLALAFKEKEEQWNMKIDKVDGTISFEEPDVLFDVGKNTVKPRFKEILNEFFPTYIDTIYKLHGESIKEIRIEGHTSSKWSEDVSDLEAFFNNMELSQSRTREVLKYVMSMPESKEYEEWLRKHMTANGLSSSKVVLNDKGMEDENKSRRVSFKIITNSEDVISRIIEEAKGKE